MPSQARCSLAKILLAPQHKGDSFIIGINGTLKVIDPQRQACVCRSCGKCRECVERREEIEHKGNRKPATSPKQPWELEAA
jgi:hypothetical protein